mgnify:CR=1 FL=1
MVDFQLVKTMHVVSVTKLSGKSFFCVNRESLTLKLNSSQRLITLIRQYERITNIILFESKSTSHLDKPHNRHIINTSPLKKEILTCFRKIFTLLDYINNSDQIFQQPGYLIET